MWLGVSVKLCCSPAWPTVKSGASLWSKGCSGRVQGGQSKQMDLSQTLKVWLVCEHVTELLCSEWNTDILPQPSESAHWELLSIWESWDKFPTEEQEDCFLPKQHSKVNMSHVQTIMVRLSNSFPGPGKDLPCQCSSSYLSIILLKMVYLRVWEKISGYPSTQVHNPRAKRHLYSLCPALFLPWAFSLPCLFFPTSLPDSATCGGSTSVTN